MIALAGHVVPYHVRKGDVLYKPGDIGREAYIVRQGIDGAKCQIVISQDELQDVHVSDGEMIGVNALQVITFISLLSIILLHYCIIEHYIIMGVNALQVRSSFFVLPCGIMLMLLLAAL